MAVPTKYLSQFVPHGNVLKALPIKRGQDIDQMRLDFKCSLGKCDKIDVDVPMREKEGETESTKLRL